MYRGRLIQPFLAVLARLDTNATATAGGYDPVFRAPKVTYPGGIRTVARAELPDVELRCQVEMGAWRAQHQQPMGNIPDSRLTLVFHFAELEAKGLIDAATGDPLIRVNDRLVSLKDIRGNLVQTVAKSQGGLYATEVQPTAYGLGRRRNLLVVIFDDRPQGATT